jgi:hypothetical protein
MNVNFSRGTTARKRAITWFFAGVSAMTLAQSAHADEPGDASVARAPRAPRWYGYQTLALDGAAAALFSSGVFLTIAEAKGDGDPTSGLAMVGLGAATYLFGAPTVHWAHGRTAAGLESLGLRVLAPFAGMGLGAVASQLLHGSRTQTEIPIGAAFGALAAAVLDGVLLGQEREPDVPLLPQGVMPRMVLRKDMAYFGMGGRF